MNVAGRVAADPFLVDDVRADAGPGRDLRVEVGAPLEELRVVLAQLLAAVRLQVSVGVFERDLCGVAGNESIDVAGVVRLDLSLDRIHRPRNPSTSHDLFFGLAGRSRTWPPQPICFRRGTRTRS
jgi:hypothetical protein